MLEGISPEWKKTMVSGRKGPAKEPIKKPHVDISSYNVRVQQIYGVFIEVSWRIAN